nr:hypothetical protein [Tanacetum cinerariifolium]
MCELACQIIQKKQEEKRIEEEQAGNARYWKILACCDDDDDYNSAITPVLSTEETDNSLSMGDEHLDTIPATESDEVINSSVEDLILIPSESEGIPDTMCDVHLVNNPTPLGAKDHFESIINSNDDISSSDDDSLYNENIEYVEASPHDSELVSLEVAEIVIPKDEEIKDHNLHEKLLNVHLLIANIKALKDNPTPSSEFLTKSSSTSPKSFLEETNTFENSLPEFENFYFDLEEISSDMAVPPLILIFLFLNNFSFIFDLSNDQFPPTDRSDFTHEEFADELTHIISPPEYDCYYFRNLPDPGELISLLNFGIHKNLSSTTRVNLPVEDDHSPLLAHVVWIFLAYLTYPVIPPYLHSFRNEDTIFDPGITINCFYSFKPGLSHQYVQYSRKCKDSCQRILSSKSSFSQLQLGIISQPMLKSSYKAEDGVIISIPPLVRGVADVVVEIKGTECLSCGALYTGDFYCSKGNVEDKILVPKLPKNCARCTRCGHPVDGPYCQGCSLLRKKLEKDLVTYFQDFQNTFESSDDSTNVVNAPREPFVVKQDHGVNPPHIDECCCDCGDALDGIFCQQCTCKSCGKGAHIGYNFPPKVSSISNPKPCNQTINKELPQTLPSFDPTCYSDKENSVPCVS